MSFSEKRVAERINAKFVSAWINRGPGFSNKEFQAETRIVGNSFEVYPTKNICTFFLTPEGKVFYYVAGSYGPDLFLKILETALSLRTVLFDERMNLREGALETAAQLHAEQADAYGELKQETEALSAKPEGWRTLTAPFRLVSYRGVKHVHNSGCAWTLTNGYDYLQELHEEWSGRSELPRFEEVRYQYRYGNEFTEEGANAVQVVAPQPIEKRKPVAKRPTARRVKAEPAKDVFGTGLPVPLEPVK